MDALTVILPTLDEAENLAFLLPELLSCPCVTSIVVVDDGSTDGTREHVETYGSRVRLIRRSAPRSLTASLQDGIDAATTPLVAWMDADGTMAVDDLPRLVLAVGAASMVVGSRFVKGGALKGQTRGGLRGVVESFAAMHRSRDGALGASLSFVLNGALLPAILGARRDWTSGFAVARREALTAVRLRGDHGEYFFDLWVRLERAGHRVVEVPVHMRPRRFGHSKTGTRWTQFVQRGVRYLTRAAALRAEGHTDAS